MEHWKYHNVTGRILLVEPDVVLAAVLEEVLGQSGHEVVIVRTLKDDRRNIRSARAVILDIDTTSVEKELAWLDEFQPSDGSLPLILLGLQVSQKLNHRLPLDLHRRQNNVLSMLQKPFRNEDLLAALQETQEKQCCGTKDRNISQRIC
jgi:DNA-binding NtrC family response regulator